MTTPEVSVIVVNYNTCELTLACLRSVFRYANGVGIEALLIDNASTDGSAERIASELPAVTVVRNDRNLGFGAANNRGMRLARGRYVLLLNSDAELVEGTIGATVAFADEHPEAGVVGCRFVYPDGRPQGSIFRVIGLWDVVLHALLPNRVIYRSRWLGRNRYIGVDLDQTLEVEVVGGAFMLVRREVIEEVGGFDEDFFMYGEEAEWCHRIRRAGWKVVYYPKPKAIHHMGASSSSSMERSLQGTQGQLLLLQKTRGSFVAYLANGVLLVRELPRVGMWNLTRPLPPGWLTRRRAGWRSAIELFKLHLRGLRKIEWWRHSSGS